MKKTETRGSGSGQLDLWVGGLLLAQQKNNNQGRYPETEFGGGTESAGTCSRVGRETLDAAKVTYVLYSICK